MAVSTHRCLRFVLFGIIFCILPSSAAGVGSTDQSSGACASQPCENGGICLEFNSAFICQCSADFKGLRCEINASISVADACTSNPCSNGLCVSSGPQQYTCMCPVGWEGENCDRDVDECRLGNYDCEPTQTCINTDGRYFCANLTCQDETNPCQNGGQCYQLAGSYPQCICAEGFDGLHCDTAVVDTSSSESDVGVCDGEHCHNQGECIPSNRSPHGFTCRCFSGFSGALCNVPLHVVCLYEEIAYHEGEVRYVDCNECHCQKGSWFCTKKFCGTIHGSFEFTNNYDLIEEEEKEFSRSLREDLIDVFSIPSKMLNDLQVSPGSIQVDLSLVSLKAQNDVKKVAAEIESMLLTANYSFTFQGTEFEVDPATVVFETEIPGEPSSTNPTVISPALDTPYVVIAIVVLSILLFVILACIARICVKRHEAKNKARQYQLNGNVQVQNVNNSRQVTTIPNHLYAVIDNSLDGYDEEEGVSVNMGNGTSQFHTYEKPRANGDSLLANQTTMEYKELEPYRDQEDNCCQLERDILQSQEL